MLDGHLSHGFEPDVAKLSSKLVDATIELHRHVMNNFLPSAVKFHYQFNLRELSNITQVLFEICGLSSLLETFPSCSCSGSGAAGKVWFYIPLHAC